MHAYAAFHRLPRLGAAWLLAATLVGTATPGHAFWGLLGKAAGKAATAGKATGAAGKAAVAGSAAAGGAELAGVGARGAVLAADDAARLAGKAPLAEGALLNVSHSANAVLPPEVAVYLSKPAKALTDTDTAHMVQLYQNMVAQAGKTGDFTAVERLPNLHGGKTLPPANTPGPAPLPLPGTPPAATTTVGIELSLHALRLLAHAAAAGNRDAQRQMQQRCQSAAPAGLAAEQAAMCQGRTGQPKA